MCGIAGVVNHHEIDLKKMMDALRHRGPDDETVYVSNQVALMHTRLAIQDIQHGVQPFHYEHYSIIFNGEIYNHLELRKRLTEFTFKTNSDTETLLYLYIKFQEKLFDLIDGMFAFCIYNKKDHTLFLARDRAGKKPLYYFQSQQRFVFASELNAIKAIQPVTVLPDAINCYLRTGFIWRPYTPYEQVLELEAGSYLLLNIDTFKLHTHSYFNLLDHFNASPLASTTLEENLSLLDQKLKQSVADRITASDVEVGVFLSGGIDSNLIAAFAAQIKPNIKTFTVKFDGLYDESPLAKLTATRYKTNHIELNVSNNLKHDIENILLSYGEPFMDSSAIPSYYVSKEARKHVKVVLGGDGADELFAGYRRYVPAAYNVSQYAKFAGPVFNFLPKPQTKQSLYNYLYRLVAMTRKSGLDFYLSATSDIFEDVTVIKNNNITQSLAQFVETVFNYRQLSLLKKMLYADFNIILFCDLLVKMDIASMANSLEVRSPFLSKHLLEFAPQLPDHYKINKLKTKYILRKLAENYLPEPLVHQPKRGFEVPLKQWIDHELREPIHDRLQPGCYAEHFVNKEFIQRVLHKKIDVPAEKRAKILWALYCLEVWHANETKNSFYS